ncbi:MAG: tyrosine-type recombinase/integrase, partial [Dehalococcoidia bacterium]|nr:tyrosine-type recombinase/integrase [Dehalococcoidia bacterium]
CERHGLHHLGDVMPIHVAAYVEQLPLSRPSVKQHLSAISRCFDWMVSGGTLEINPATSVQRPKHVVRVGKTPVLSDEQARQLLESISIDRLAGLRDRALIGTMLYTFGRVGAVIAMDVKDYRISNHQRSFLLHEEGGKEHQVPAHHKLIEYLGEYMDATDLWSGGRHNEVQAEGCSHQPASGLPDGETSCQEGRAATDRQLPQLPGHGHHELPVQRRSS